MKTFNFYRPSISFNYLNNNKYLPQKFGFLESATVDKFEYQKETQIFSAKLQTRIKNWEKRKTQTAKPDYEKKILELYINNIEHMSHIIASKW